MCLQARGRELKSGNDFSRECPNLSPDYINAFLARSVPAGTRGAFTLNLAVQFSDYKWPSHTWKE